MTTGVRVAGSNEYLRAANDVEAKKVSSQALNGKEYDAFNVVLKNKENENVQPTGPVRVTLPVLDRPVENVYYVTPTNTLETLDFSQHGTSVEFLTGHFSVYAVVYKSDESTAPANAHKVVVTAVSGQKSTTNKLTALPKTGESKSEVAFMAGLLLALSSLFVLKQKEQ